MFPYHNKIIHSTMISSTNIQQSSAFPRVPGLDFSADSQQRSGHNAHWSFSENARPVSVLFAPPWRLFGVFFSEPGVENFCHLPKWKLELLWVKISRVHCFPGNEQIHALSPFLDAPKSSVEPPCVLLQTKPGVAFPCVVGNFTINQGGRPLESRVLGRRRFSIVALVIVNFFLTNTASIKGELSQPAFAANALKCEVLSSTMFLFVLADWLVGEAASSRV